MNDPTLRMKVFAFLDELSQIHYNESAAYLLLINFGILEPEALKFLAAYAIARQKPTLIDELSELITQAKDVHGGLLNLRERMEDGE